MDILVSVRRVGGWVAVACLAGHASAQILNEDVKLPLPAGITGGEQFGHNVAIEGDVAVVGSLFDNARGDESGSAFVYDANTGVLVSRILGNDTASDDGFSDGIAISNGLIYVGAPENEANGRQSGRTYIFQSGSNAQIDVLDPERIVFVGEDPVGAAFGWSVDAADGFIAVGSPGDVEGANGGGGAVYIYNETTRTRVGKFFASDAGFADNMGRRVATASGRVLASSPFDDDNGTDAGAVYLFDAATGQEITKIVPDDVVSRDQFGLAIAADGETIVAGAPFADGDGTSAGAVYLFDLQSGAQIGTLRPDDIAPGDQFGRAVAIDGDLIVVASRTADPQGSASGKVYAFDRVTGNQIAVVLPSDGAAGDVFGNAVAVSGRRVLVGAEGDADRGALTGAAYLFTVDTVPCLADTNGDGELTPADFNAWVIAFNANSAACDQNGDGACRPADFNAWVLNFNSGCP
ncbi:MAG: GC-type dockerin domain-anchored protein [Planctomycetota bacterium]